MNAGLLLVFLFSAALAEYTSYEGYVVYSVTPKSPRDSAILQEIYDSGKFDFWSKSKAVNHPVHVMVSPDLQETFISTIEKFRMDYEILIEDVEKVNAAERERQARAPRVANGRIDFQQYHSYDAILAYLQQVAVDYPDIVTYETYGYSYEGRPLVLLRVNGGSTEGKPTIFIEGGIHAREWIAPAVVLYIIQQLVENPDNRALVENANWILVTVTNPDGYEYSRTYSRMWRKTRSIGVTCNGADGNRNFDFQWGGPGTSTSECSEIFIGRSPFSESETRTLADVALAEENIDIYLAIHSYGNWILYPWGYTFDQAENADELHEVGLAAAAAIEAVAGTQYTVGNSALLLYFAAGASDDWFKAIANAPLSYTVELPGGGSQGFDLPANRIQPVVTETWPGIVAFYEYVVRSYRK
ncbi:hypothetical protein Trydic_g946 [Trypoxylus dichotomus]